MHPLSRIRSVTETILKPDLHYGNVHGACNELYGIFRELTGFSEEDPSNNSDIIFEEGLAVGPYSAAFCLIDFWRTRQFMMGIRSAIEDRRKEQSGQPVTILYAGTGPFATLLLPFCSLYSSDELQLVLLEINSQSFHFLERLIAETGTEQHIKHKELANACTWQIPDDLQPDILLSETMKKGLEKEPQVAVFAALLPQCKNDPILLPEEIIVSAALMGNMQKDPPELDLLGSLLTLNKETALLIKNDPSSVPALNEGIIVKIDEETSSKSLVLHTDIRIYKDVELKFNESSITLPHRLAFDDKNTPCRLRFKYDLGNKPGFHFTSLQA